MAKSWTGKYPNLESKGDFHDEGEEIDEAEEGEDVSRWVGVAEYVLRKARTSNKMLHELARAVRGVEMRRGKPFSSLGYKTIFDQWEAPSKPFLRVGQDYFTEFLTKLDYVTNPKGVTLESAFERAKRAEPPEKVLVSDNDGIRTLASLCRELQEMAGDQPIMLVQERIAKLFGHGNHRNISNWISALKSLGVLRLVEQAVPGKRAARYIYQE